jgi:hypothetical protein
MHACRCSGSSAETESSFQGISHAVHEAKGSCIRLHFNLLCLCPKASRCSFLPSFKHGTAVRSGPCYRGTLAYYGSIVPAYLRSLRCLHPHRMDAITGSDAQALRGFVVVQVDQVQGGHLLVLLSTSSCFGVLSASRNDGTD